MPDTPSFDANKQSSWVKRYNAKNVKASGDNIGLQIKPDQAAASSGSVFGLQVEPRVSDGFALTGSGSIIGIHTNPYLKGTTARTIGGDVRSLNVEVVTDDAAAHTVSGNVNAIRIRSAFSATTITGKFVPIRIEKAEAQTNSKQYDAVLELPSTNAGVWHDTQTTATPAGFIGVLINGNLRYIQTYSGTPS